MKIKKDENILEKYHRFVETEPVMSILSRNLYYLMGRNKLACKVEISNDFSTGYKGGVIYINIPPYLLSAEYGRAHWLAALRFALAHEVQHINSSDRKVQKSVKVSFERYMSEEFGIDTLMPLLVAEKIAEILEDGRVNNIVCARFPGYIPLVRFAGYIRCLNSKETKCAYCSVSMQTLSQIIIAIEARAISGIKLIGIPSNIENEVFTLTDRAVLAETAAQCGDYCIKLLATCGKYIAEACADVSDDSASATDFFVSPEEYAFSEDSRDEQKGDGSDSRIINCDDQPADSIEQIIVACKGVAHLKAISKSETEDLLLSSAEELDRENQLLKANQVNLAGKSLLAKGDIGELKSRYENVDYTEVRITPGNSSLNDAAAAKKLHNKLERILHNNRIRREGEHTGLVSRKCLWKVGINDSDVFSRKTTPNRYECSFCLLLDKSGSMGASYHNGESKIVTALKTAAVIEEALKGIAYTKIIAFDGTIDSVGHTIIKDYCQKETGSRCTDALTKISAGNGNKDGYSIRFAAKELSKRREQQKILVILSDGLPSGYKGESEAISDVRTAVQEARRSGLIVVPILYDSSEPEKNMSTYRQMYEKGIICASQESVLGDFEKVLISLIR